MHLPRPPSDEVAAHDWASGGAAWLTGHRAGPPLRPPGHAASWARWMTEHLARAGGIELDGPALLGERAALTGAWRQGRRSVGGSCRLLRTRDGWAAVSNARPDDPLLLAAMIGIDRGDDLDGAVARWVRAHDGAELDERAALLSVAAASCGARAREVPVPGHARPVQDLLVVDFSALWAGPLCAHLLGLAGARVVKVETPSRPDGARFGNRAFYDLLHQGHASVVLDPDDPAQRRALHALVRRADIVIEASRPRALAGFGLDAGEFVAGGGTWVSITAWGRDADRIGFGDDVAAASGLVAIDVEGLPVFCGDAIADPLTGMTAAALVMSEPSGVLWDMPMAGVVGATTPAPDFGVPSEVLPDAAAPTARRPVAAAPAMGADTDRVLRQLGVP
ncbi:MAG TPA: CoA transferase [Amycolatopsis sp.]|uniref:CoA transferase n=1 Tax=Amycolatopsis sp. TaxID=37632 RepID=UPI002B49B4B4|nr:CoA transferase [Amycolatopsis sp.]HKS47032.1 CoA transferase [Amycolatopsis sp.]